MRVEESFLALALFYKSHSHAPLLESSRESKRGENRAKTL
jgi:hypothetical protein